MDKILPLKRKCPKCGKKITYAKKWSLKFSILNNSNCKSCSHTGIKVFRDAYKFIGFENIPNWYFYVVKSAAYKKKRFFSISIKDLNNQWIKQGGKCIYTGEILCFSNSSKKNIKNTTASLDRIDSSEGYTSDNIQWVHKDINTLKTDFEQDKFIGLCNKVSFYHEYNNIETPIDLFIKSQKSS